MVVSLRPLDRDNLAQCFALEVSDVQKNHAQIPDTPEIITETLSDPPGTILTIYSDDTMVGLIAFFHPEGAAEYEITYFLIDQKHQSKGYGKSALKQTIAFLCEKPDCQRIKIRYMFFNDPMIRLCGQVGFIEVAEESGYVDAALECGQSA